VTGYLCEWCKKEFDHKAKRGPKPRFCKASCRQRAFEARRAAVLDFMHAPEELRSDMAHVTRSRPDPWLMTDRPLEGMKVCPTCNGDGVVSKDSAVPKAQRVTPKPVVKATKSSTARIGSAASNAAKKPSKAQANRLDGVAKRCPHPAQNRYHGHCMLCDEDIK
jgi:hypothetical protein